MSTTSPQSKVWHENDDFWRVRYPFMFNEQMRVEFLQGSFLNFHCPIITIDDNDHVGLGFSLDF